MLSEGKLGFWGLTALVFGLVVGTGIFNLPQALAQNAGPAAVTVCWLTAAAGMMPLVVAFRWLSVNYPQYNAGIYHYAQAGFGNFTGFVIAWGYWLCSAFSNVAYGVMLNDSCGAFFPQLLNHGWWTFSFCSFLIWLMYFIVSRGISTAKTVNSVLAGVKVAMILLIIGVFAVMFKADIFQSDIWGESLHAGSRASGFAAQLKSTMMIALFCFFGIEGAVMMSSRARRPSDVGRAGLAGFLLALVLYLAVSLLCFGVETRASLAGLNNPSVAYILRDTVGDWAYWFVITALTVSLLGGWVAWTLIVAQVPQEAARVKILPKWFSHKNRHGMPDYGMIASSLAMEGFLLIVIFEEDAYLTSLEVSGLMIIPGYLFTGLFLWKTATSAWLKAIAASIAAFCCWMAYAGGLADMALTSLFYLAGIPFYLRSIKERNAGGEKIPTFDSRDRRALAFLIICAAVSLIITCI